MRSVANFTPFGHQPPHIIAAALPLMKCQPCSIHRRRFLHCFERAVSVFVGRSESIFPLHFTLANTQDMKKGTTCHATAALSKSNHPRITPTTQQLAIDVSC